MATLLIGYDVECADGPEITRAFLKQALVVHSELGAPCTLFALGRVVEQCADDMLPLKETGLFDFQQHTYSHVLLKTVCMDDGSRVTVVPSGTIQQVDEEIRRANAVMNERLGVRCAGLTGPWGYYRGLMDRPDLLEVVHRHGIRFLRTYARNEKDFQPVPFEAQPFWYEPQGFGDVLECCIHGWQDVHWKMLYGWDNLRGYIKHLYGCLDYAAERGLVFSYGSHDWSSIREDPEMSVIAAFVKRAQAKGFRVMSYLDFYEEQASMKQQVGPGREDK